MICAGAYFLSSLLSLGLDASKPLDLPQGRETEAREGNQVPQSST